MTLSMMIMMMIWGWWIASTSDAFPVDPVTVGRAFLNWDQSRSRKKRTIPDHHLTTDERSFSALWWTPTATRPVLFATIRPDLDVIFGSESQPQRDEDGRRSSDADEPDDSDARWTAWQQHKDQVQSLLEQSQQELRQERKVQQWGAFSNVTNARELTQVLAQERQSVESEHAVKAQLAQQAGVFYTVLEPRAAAEESAWTEDSGQVLIQSGSGRSASSAWLSDVDEELRAEWEALVQNRQLDASEEEEEEQRTKGSGSGRSSRTTASSGPSKREGKVEDLVDDTSEEDGLTGSDEDLEEEGEDFRAAAADVQVDSRSGKMISRAALAGVRVGSAGGWTLEVFPGDFVVHRKYGIGRFERTCLRPKTKLTPDEKKARDDRRAELLTKELRQRQEAGVPITADEIQSVRSKFGTDQDTDPISNPQTTVLEISYADAVVHVPVDRAYRLSRYRAGDAVIKPKLSRVKGDAWAKAKSKVEENTLQLAQDVLALYATRETLQRPPFDPATEAKVKVLESTFPYEPTPDQRRCFEEVENDMVWRNRPMDRLVCGDVGFGKTEVAMRALYRAVANGRQAVMLAPTGVLAAQHFKNIVKRMGPDSPFKVEVALLRGGMGKQTRFGRDVRDRIASGEIQLVVGTHALLSNGLNYRNLGLLVVDEEQRFGVKQKERLKLLCSGIDVLTLSATPIPRTLQMSLSGIRDTSTIRSPPPMRKPTITFVQEFSESMVQDAISRELARGGQCYYVVPRIAMLNEAQELIQRLFPDIRIIQAHGRMQRNGAEESVAAFAEGQYDVLLATTVIENGVDIPTVNTIIVQNSQAFGMSTLYQLRGRVGRSDQQAYAYFLHREESITEQAAMRLQAIGELNELGSGFDIANRDLEIRGAGSLLGTEQSGMAAKVGFDLYMRMLKKSIRKLRGLDLPLVPRTNVLLPTDGTPTTFKIPSSYISSIEERKREESRARLAESTTKLVDLTNAWKEKYGTLPSSLQNKLKTLHLHACARRLGIDLVGVIESGSGEASQVDCILRSPGLRPRHWAIIAGNLPKGAGPKGLDIIFPSRFTQSGKDEEVKGGRKLDLKALLADESFSEEREEEEWDSMDQEEIEAMKDISSAVNVKNLNEVDLEQYPRFIIRGFESSEKAVDRLLKLLLPIAKIVYEKQAEQAEQAQLAADLRQKQEILRNRRKANEALDAQKLGYYY